jgi:hypothetical protein
MKKIFFVVSVPMICWQESSMVVKKNVLALFVSVNALLFSMQYGHTSFPCVPQPETISYVLQPETIS